MQKLHDHNITGIKWNITSKELTLSLSEDTGIGILKNHKLSIFDVQGWELSSFEIQNIIFEFRDFSNKDLDESIIENFEIDSSYVNLVKEYNYVCFTIDSSVGMSRFVIAKSCDYTQLF